jgi:hypothetical protein
MDSKKSDAGLYGSKPKGAQLVTDTGEHPAIVIRQASNLALILGLVLDLVALIGIVVLIALDKLTPAEGLPWIALLLGGKAAAMRRRKPPPSGGTSAALSLFGY